MSKKKKDIEEENQQICEQCEDHVAGWKRALADYDNLKKNLNKEREETCRGVKQDVGQQLIAVLDNFDQAVKFRPMDVSSEVESWLTGVTYVQNQFDEVLAGLGLESFGQVGETFDPNLHDAAGERSEESKEDQEILEVQRRGWRMGDIIVRPAKVIINNQVVK